MAEAEEWAEQQRERMRREAPMDEVIMERAIEEFAESLDALLDRWRRPDGTVPSDIQWLVDAVRESERVSALASVRAEPEEPTE